MNVENFAEDFDFPHVSDAMLARERLIFNTTEDLLLAMQDCGINRADVAKKMGRSKSHITQILDGNRNLTLNTLSDIAHAIGVEVKIAIKKDGIDVSHQIVPERDVYETRTTHVESQGKQVVKIFIARQHMEYVQNGSR